MASIAAQITPTGIVAPSYPDILQQLKSQFWSIYGSDANLDDDSQDGQWIAVFAQAIFDSNQIAIDIYNSFSPVTAQGANLSNVVKINGIARKVATNSQAIATVAGVAGTTINEGLIGDNLNQNTQWALPNVVEIPGSGAIDVTVVCTTPGNTPAPEGSLTQILTPTRGWQSVTNTTAGTPGTPVESDAQLRQRQFKSTALTSKTILEGIYAAVANIPNVTDLLVYENDTDTTDGNGVPSHSIALVVLGGDVQEIAQTLADTKSPGTGTYGDIVTTIIDPNGVPLVIRFFELTLVPVYARITITPLVGFTDIIGDKIKQSVSDWINSLQIGEDVFYTKLFGPANLFNDGSNDGETFNVTDLRSGLAPAPTGQATIVIAFTARAFCTPDNVNLIVT